MLNQSKIAFKTHKREIIAFGANALAAFSAFYFKDNLAILVFSVLVFIGSLFSIIYLKTKDKDFYYLPLDKPGEGKDWVGRGEFRYIRNEKCFEITQSNTGYIFPKTALWDDYSYKFSFKIVNKTISLIVRAVNLSNNIMLQLAYDGINPHMRLNGQWVKISTHEEAKLSFRENLNPDTWYTGKIICEKRSIRIVIYEKREPVFDRHWIIPDQLKVTYFQDEKQSKQINILQNIDFDFGAIGVRNDADERGFIKNVYVEKL